MSNFIELAKQYSKPDRLFDLKLNISSTIRTSIQKRYKKYKGNIKMFN